MSSLVGSTQLIISYIKAAVSRCYRCSVRVVSTATWVARDVQDYQDYAVSAVGSSDAMKGLGMY